MGDFGWTEYRDQAEAETRARRAHLASIRARLQHQQRIERLEEELHWTNSLASALAGLCIAKGVVTPDELKEHIAKVEEARAAQEKAAALAAAPPPVSKAPLVSGRRRVLRRGSGRARPR